MKTLATILLGLGAALAVLFGGYLAWVLIGRFFETVAANAAIQYSSKQIDVLTDTAKTLIPTVAGFAVLAASGSGYLHTHGHMQSQGVKLAVFSVFLAVVFSVACWINLLGAMVDCSRPFDRIDDKALSPVLTIQSAGSLQHTYGDAVLSAKLACVSFFFALDIALLITVRVFSDAKRPKPNKAYP